MDKYDVKFSGVKFSEIRLTMHQIRDLMANGRSVIQVGVWDDGTPAFSGLELNLEQVELREMRS